MSFSKTPNFFIIGAPKCGTTSIHAYLESHPDVYMSDPKELNYFSGSQILDQRLYYDSFVVKSKEEYLSIFGNTKKEKIIGEASVSYLYYDGVAAKIHQFNPNARLLIVLRDPIKRAYSHYLMDHKLGLVKYSFKEIFENPDKKKHQLHYQQYFSLSQYYAQLKPYFDLFPKNQIKIYLQEDLKKNPSDVMKDLAEYLELKWEGFPDLSVKHNTYVESKNAILGRLYKIGLMRSLLKTLVPKELISWIKKVMFRPALSPKIDKRLEDRLRNFYLEDIDKTQLLINRDLSIWK